MPSLQLQLLGHFHLRIDGEPVSIPQPRLQSLLAYVLIHRHSAQLRQHLAFTFWPDSTEPQARGNLRKALFDLRTLIPDLDHYLQGKDPNQEAASIYLDVSTFEELSAQIKVSDRPSIQQPAMEQAIHLYTGDFLPACYDDWILSERERLRQHYLYILEQLVCLFEEQRDYASAALHAQRLLQADPLRESVYRTLMRLHLFNGDRARAIQVYHTCATLLQQELDVEPSAETQAAYKSLLHLEAAPVIPPAAQRKAALVGRRPEWSLLLKEWRSAFQGQAHFVLIGGEAGIGKTRLAEELLQWVEQQSFATARARSYAAEGQLAYAPIAEWLRAGAIRKQLVGMDSVWLSEVARLQPELLVERPNLTPPQPLADSWQRQRFREALARALIVGKRPLLLLIDDLQWCDRETLEWLHYLLRFAAAAPLLIVATVRPEEIGQEHPLTTLLINLRQEGKVSEVELGPLDSDETGELAAMVAGHALDARQAATLYIETEGHPLFVVETMRAKESGIRATPPIGTTDLPPKVQAIIGSRLLQLAPATRELMEVAAVVGRAFNVDILAEAGAVDDEALARALDELWQRRIIREQAENAYDFSHDRIREAAYSSVSPPRRRLLHRRVAEALEHLHHAELDALSGQIATHYELAGLTEQAILYYQRAAEVAQHVYAHADAANLLAIALKLLSDLPSSVEHLRQKLKSLLTLGVSFVDLKGMPHVETNELYTQAHELAVRLGDKQSQLVALAGLHTTLLTSARVQAAYDLSQHEIALAKQVGSRSQLLEAHCKLGMVMMHQGQWPASREYMELLLGDADYQWSGLSHATAGQHWGLTTRRHLAVTLWHLGYPDQALKTMEESLTFAKKSDYPSMLITTVSWYAWLYYFRREIQLAQEWAERAIVLCQQQNSAGWLPSGLATKGWALAQQRQSKAGITAIKEALALRLLENSKLRQPDFLIMLADCYAIAGEPEQTVRLLDEAIALIEATGEHFSEAEVYRLKAAYLPMQGDAKQEAEACLLHSLAVARQQEAKSLELRTATSLARLWQKQGKRQQAYDLLAPIYEWFTEGLDTLDLIEAKALLEALA